MSELYERQGPAQFRDRIVSQRSLITRLEQRIAELTQQRDEAINRCTRITTCLGNLLNAIREEAPDLYARLNDRLAFRGAEWPIKEQKESAP